MHTRSYVHVVYVFMCEFLVPGDLTVVHLRSYVHVVYAHTLTGHIKGEPLRAGGHLTCMCVGERDNVPGPEAPANRSLESMLTFQLEWVP